MKRILAAILVIFGCAFAFVQLHRFYSRKFFVSTGEARWIWDRNRIAAEEPVVFFATREFELPANRAYVHLKIAADPEYTLYFNGEQLGGRRYRGTGVVDRYNVSELAKTGTNRIVVAVRSAKGVGGLLAGVDLGAMLENIVVTDDQWKIFHVWSDGLLKKDPANVAPITPRVLGVPPIGRWDYLQETSVPVRNAQRIALPRSSVEFAATLPQIKVASGVAVQTSRPARARAFDFGFVRGRARIEVDPVGHLVTRIRYVNDASEFDFEGEVVSLPVAPGEQFVVDPEVRRFRYIIIYDVDARATVLVD